MVGRALVCMGPSGAGKSTLAAALMQRGYPVLADDVVAIDLEGRALPGLPHIKLWNDAAQHLAVSTEGLSRILPSLDKFNLPLAGEAASAPVPAGWAQAGIEITPVRGIDSFRLLQNNLYRARILRALSPLPEHLKLFGEPASRVRIARAARQEDGFALEALVDALLADAAVHG